MNKWFKHSYWRNLVDMHIPDWNPDFMAHFSPEQYAANMLTAEVDASELYTGNCLGICFWPTKAGHMHAGLKGRDIVGSTLQLLQNENMFTLAYFNIWSRWAFDTHPDWRLLRINGTNTTQLPGGKKSRFGQCCLNSPGYRAYLKAQMEDLANQYDFDGAWIDMLGWFGTVCCCPDCRRRYYDETGREIPETINWFDPDWVLFQRKREAWLADLAHLISSILRTLKPDISITFNCAAWQRGWTDGNTQSFFNESDYLAGDFYGNSLMYSTICKFLNNASQNRPIEFMTSRCVSLRDHTTTKTSEELEFSAYGSFAHNGAFVFIDAINPDGTMNDKLYADMGALHRKLKKFQIELAPDAVLLRDVSYLFNFESFINPKANGISIRDMAEGKYAETISGSPRAKMMNISKLMIADHLAFDLTCLKQLDEAAQESQLIVVPNQYVMLEEELTKLQDFVSQGGSLLITGQSGQVDREGNRLSDFAHAAMSGVHLLGETAEDVTYLRPMPGFEALFTGYDEKYPMSVDRPAALVRIDEDVQVIARLTLPWSHSQEIHHFGSAISNPPGIDTDYPALTLHPYGSGQVMYLSVPLEEIEFEAQQQIFTGLMRYLIKKPVLIQTNAPSWLELLVYADKERNSYLIYALKIMETYYEGSVQNVEISVRLPGVTGILRDITTGESVMWHRQDDFICWTAEQISDFAMYRLTTD
ncbi:MAG: beta-galactosidase trimerization domain-containing protein [Bacillota bacterium]|nr:beta-galactosidase trimerization domain-containing protein [Bacillota bacterium]